MTDEERATRLSAALNLLRLDSLTTGDDPEEKRQHEAIRAAFAAVRKEKREECARLAELAWTLPDLSSQTVTTIKLIVDAIRTDQAAAPEMARFLGGFLGGPEEPNG